MPERRTGSSGHGRRRRLSFERLAGLAVTAAALAASAPLVAQPDWEALEPEILEHFQAIVQRDSTSPPLVPPGGEKEVVDYLRTVLESEGIPVKIFALEENRPNLVARLEGSGKKQPLLVMAHTDTVNVDPAKWTAAGPFSAERKDGHIYGRGTVDDKDNVVAGLMILLELKRQQVPLDRDVIFLAEAGEEGNTHVGIAFMVEQHWSEIEAEYAIAEGGSVLRSGGEISFASVQTLEKLPFRIELVARGVAGHGSVPLQSNPVARLSKAVAKIADWPSPMRLNETTSAYFQRMAELVEARDPEAAERYRSVLDPERIAEADEHFREHEPHHASMLRTSLSPTILDAGYRINVIPSEARASVDTRALPDEEIESFLDQVRAVIDDDAVEVSLGQRATRPGSGDARLNTEAFEVIERMVARHYDTATLPSMSTGATDMAFLRARGIQSYGIGPVRDVEDGPKGFGAHSDQERILEEELYRFVRFHYDVVVELAAAR